MKQSGKKTIISLLSVSVLLVTITACSNNTIKQNADSRQKEIFLSEQYEHFNNGVLFPDVEMGLNVLWEASFMAGRAYKENLGFFVPGGLLILPNKDNTIHSSRLSALPVFSRDGKLFVEHQGFHLEVYGIIHTHPDEWGISGPTPTSDFQFSYLGIHNYILCHYDLLDAYRDVKGNETYVRLGARNAYSKIPTGSPTSLILTQI